MADNGGPTQTMALGFGSVALDHIPTSLLEANGCGVTVTTDQRGLPRAGGTGAGGPACDVGA
ncbi:MAG: choice-of-anchor Q domain-containing protein [Caldilineales bacterium]